MTKPLALLASAALLAACSSSSVGALDGGADVGTAHRDAAGTDGTMTAGGTCSVDGQCSAFLAKFTPSPPGCAEAYCDTLLSRCALRPVDQDMDTYRTAACSVPGATFTPGTDCNDHDPNLYPGHAEDCVVLRDAGTTVLLPDGGTAGACKVGQVSCLANGTESACTGSVVCAAAECVAGACVDECLIGGTSVGAGAVNPANACETCQPAASTTAYTALADGQGCATGQCCASSCSDLQSDVMNCGACGQACTPGESCTAGLCAQTLAITPGQPGGIALGTSSVYWTVWYVGSDAGYVNAVPIGGGAQTTLTSSPGAPVAIAVDATNVYWTTPEGSGTVSKLPLVGGDGVPVTLVSGQDDPDAVAVDATNVYWANGSVTGSIATLPIGGGSTPTTLATGQSRPQFIAVDATHIYWVNDGSDSVVKVGLTGGGAPTTLVTGQPDPCGIAVDATSVYWVTQTVDEMDGVVTGTLMKAGLDGSMLVTLASLQGQPAGVAVDAMSVYTTVAPTSGSATVIKVPIGGGAATTLAVGPNDPGIVGIAVDSTSVYWANGNSIRVDGGFDPPVMLKARK